MLPNDTIAAISSSIGLAARIILRLSGPRAYAIASAIIKADLPAPSFVKRVTLHVGAPASPTSPSPRTRGEGRGEGPTRGAQPPHPALTLPAWIYLFSAPHSYTTEDLIEFHIPGSPLLAQILLNHLIELGVRHAQPGEFTARAFFAGRLDLSEAEGVAATIAASNEDELKAARQLLAGELARRLRPIMDNLAETLALIEAGIDFSDQDDVTFLPTPEIEKRLTDIDAQLHDLVTTSTRFDRLHHEPHFVLVGRPNAGKSTLLNTLAGHDRAVVSPIPGTTRDTLSAQIRLPRGFIHLTDVAGLEENSSPSPGTPGEGMGEGQDQDAIQEIESKMESHALRTLESADRLILLHDATDPRPALDLPRPPDLFVLTKSDLAPSIDPSRFTFHVSLPISSHTRHNIPTLRSHLDHLAFGSLSASPQLALNTRHLNLITESRTSLSRARNNLHASPELLAADLRESLDHLGQILGHLSPDDLLGRIFSSFCIGK